LWLLWGPSFPYRASHAKSLLKTEISESRAPFAPRFSSEIPSENQNHLEPDPFCTLDLPKSTQINPNQPKSSQIKPNQAKSSQIQPNPAKSSQIKPNQAKSSQIKPNQAKSSQIKPNG
jgi:hypothetical protein